MLINTIIVNNEKYCPNIPQCFGFVCFVVCLFVCLFVLYDLSEQINDFYFVAALNI